MVCPRARGPEGWGSGSQEGQPRTKPCSHRNVFQGLGPLFKEQEAATGIFWAEVVVAFGRAVLTAERRMGWMGGRLGWI